MAPGLVWWNVWGGWDSSSMYEAKVGQPQDSLNSHTQIERCWPPLTSPCVPYTGACLGEGGGGNPRVSMVAMPPTVMGLGRGWGEEGRGGCPGREWGGGPGRAQLGGAGGRAQGGPGGGGPGMEGPGGAQGGCTPKMYVLHRQNHAF